MRDEKSLAHTRWNCKYHIVFAPKYRRQVFYREKRRAIGSILRKLCEWKNVNILEAEYCGSHPYASGDPAQDECLGIYGVPEGKEQSDAL
ncbi:transposase IS200 like family protein [Yersinia pseudotuberculosis]|nr:transposase IS200 like family protein [Yersinia pseudotuberculosis]